MHRALIIDDEPELKAYDNGLVLENMVVAKTVEEGIQALRQNAKFDKLYLDCRLPDGSHVDILTWLSDHLDKVPESIISVSFQTRDNFYPMVDALQQSARR